MSYTVSEQQISSKTAVVVHHHGPSPSKIAVLGPSTSSTTTTTTTTTTSSSSKQLKCNKECLTASGSAEGVETTPFSGVQKSGPSSSSSSSLSSCRKKPKCSTSSSPGQGSSSHSQQQQQQSKNKQSGTILLCCCCTCPWSDPGNKNNEEKKRRYNNKDCDSGISPLKEEQIRVSAEEVRSWETSFDKLMKNNDGRKIFRNFLRGEYSEENILFWLACEDFKRHVMDKDYIDRKSNIVYLNYIHPDSTTEVSLDSRVREIVKKHLEHPEATMYDEAQLQIYTLMQRDSYPRFLNSPNFKDLRQRAAKKSPHDLLTIYIPIQKNPSLHTLDFNNSSFLTEPAEEPRQHGQTTSQSKPLLCKNKTTKPDDAPEDSSEQDNQNNQPHQDEGAK